MQGASLALSPALTPFLKPRLCSTLSLSSLEPADLAYSHRVSCLQTCLFGSFTRLSCPISPSFICSNQIRYDSLKVRAASVPGNKDDTPKPSAAIRTLQLGGLFGLWYLLNIYFNIFNKQKQTIWVVSSLVPIVGGVVLASFTEASFNWIGFCSAMASNVTNQSRNVFSKKFMVRKEDTLDNINLFSVITVISFTLLVPAAIFMEGTKFTPSYLHSAVSQGLNITELCVRSLLAAFCFHAYQQVSYIILQMVSAVTHSVGNSVKRVVVIVSSVIFFQTPVSPINSLGTAVALAGVLLYSRAKQMRPKTKTA